MKSKSERENKSVVGRNPNDFTQTYNDKPIPKSKKRPKYQNKPL